jgi:hypothetical protein
MFFCFVGCGKKDTASSASTQSEVKIDPMELKVTSAEGEKDSIVKVAVEVAENPGFMAALMSITYDKENLQYVGYEKADILSDYEFSKGEGELKFICAEEADVTANGVLFNLKFKVIGDKESEIKIASAEFVNYNEQDIPANITNGKITVK